MFDDEKSAHQTTVFPVGLLDREPGPQLAAFLSVVDPAELSGHDKVLVLQAHQKMASHYAARTYQVTDPETGMPVHVGTTKRRPDAGQQRHVELRDLTCATPGCRMPATECDLDHIKPWAETGKTNVIDLAPGCRHDHVGRHRFGWKYKRLPGGDYLWISPLGHRYTKSGRPPTELD